MSVEAGSGDNGSERIEALRTTDEQFRRAAPDPEVVAQIMPLPTTSEIIECVFESYADRPALARRRREPRTDPTDGRTTEALLPEFETQTYRETWLGIMALAGLWHHEIGLQAGDRTCFLGFPSADYAIADLACSYLGLVAVPLQHGAHSELLKPIAHEVEARAFVCGAEYLDAAVDTALHTATVEHILVVDVDPDRAGHRERLDAARARIQTAGREIRVALFPEVLAQGFPAAPGFRPADDPLALLIYTSGSTGTPKGAMYLHSAVTGLWKVIALKQTYPAIHLNFLPMSHGLGRSMLVSTLVSGGTAYFAAASDLSTLDDDIALARPTGISFVPRLCESLYRRFNAERDRRCAAGEDPADVTRALRAEYREKHLGGRLVHASFGGAPLAPDIHAFMEAVLDGPLHNDYGATEAAGILADGKIRRPPVLDYKLVDVPELGYFGTDKPHPRGELRIKSMTVIPGYYKRPELTAEMLDEDGYYKTGDVMAETAPDHLVFVDRRKNVVKLSHGEFVAVGALESAYGTSPYVRQIYVDADSTQSYVLAVVVPDAGLVDLYADDPVTTKRLILRSLQQIAQDKRFHSYEIPRDILVESDPFRPGNGLMSTVGKLMRPAVQAHYRERLAQLYLEVAQAQQDQLRALRERRHDAPVADTVRQTAAAMLGVDPDEVAADARFTDLGGDSLSAVAFTETLGGVYGLDISVAAVIDPSATLADVGAYIERHRDGTAAATPASIHGPDQTVLRAADLTVAKFIDDATAPPAAAARKRKWRLRFPWPKRTPAQPGPTVVLTGATGWLGRYLCLEWLGQLAETDGRLVCVVRGRDADAARQRLEDAFGSDPALSAQFKDLAADRLEVVPGALTEPRLGLAPGTWDRLAASADRVVHAGALVNHVLPYRELFGPNVVGTAEVIRLALASRIKAVDFVSSVAVTKLAGDDFDEAADLRLVRDTVPNDDRYAEGYALSKWAGEVLLRDAAQRHGLPVTVFRSTMVLAHPDYAGQLNTADSFTRLLSSVLRTGLAPGSFYRRAADGQSRPAHYDGLPVDFVAAAIARLGAQRRDGYRTFNAVNPHEDGISLDTVVRWLIDDGHDIDIVDDYDTWLGRFEQALRTLPDDRRRGSVLPLLAAHREPLPPVDGVDCTTELFEAAVHEAGLGDAGAVPHLTRDLIRKYAADLKVLGL